MQKLAGQFSDGHVPRRAFLIAAAAGTGRLAANCPVFAESGAGNPPITGVGNRNLEPFDHLMASFIDENHVPGASLAITRSGKLVYARGFGFADLTEKQPVQPDSLFRIASVSKPLTGVAVVQLAERGKLKLDDRVLDHLRPTFPDLPSSKLDPRWKQITVRQCLQHTGGWDRAMSYDPIGRPWEIAKALGIEPPVTPTHIVRYMLGQPLDFEPGARFAYSNLGYLVLGRIIEAVTGQTYEAYVKQEVLAPLGIKRARLGRALPEHRVPDEVRYHDASQRTGAALYPPRLGRQVPVQDGADNLEAYDAHGGWIASAVELVKFSSAFDNPARCRILGQRAIVEMFARPEGAAGTEPDGKPRGIYYGCGWNVRPVDTLGKVNTWHDGLIAGTAALLVRRWDGLNWAALFNTDHNRDGKFLGELIDGRLHEAAAAVRVWPNTNLFGRFLK